MADINTFLPYIYAAATFIVMILLYIAYTAWRIKRIIKRQIEYENQGQTY